jgi:oligoendopeptidase F
VPLEFAEVASMSMEWIGGMYTTESGIYNEDEARREHLKKYERFFLMLADVVSVDAFQQWAYENPDLAVQPDALAAKWLELTRRYMPWIDISGLEDFAAHGWHNYLHIFKVPFYVIEYAYAMLGSVQVWRNYLKDPRKAIADYRHALSLGATLPLPKLYEAAGATFETTPDTLRELSTLVLEHINKLERE